MSVVDRQLYGKKKESFWISYIKQRITRNKNFICFVSGQTGSGKSYSCLKICQELDPEFNIDRIVFNGLDLMKLINSGTLKKGSAIILEETGVAVDSKSWQSRTNRLLNHVVQTFRHKNFCLFMNSPYMDFVDAGLRKLFHAEFATCSIDTEKETVRLKPHLIQYNSRQKKFYFKRLKVITSRGKLPISFWNVGKAKQELIDQYEAKKTAYTDKLNQQIELELQAVEDKKFGKTKKELTDKQQDVLELLKQGLNVEQIAKEKDRAKRVIYSCMELIKKKGYQFEPVYDKIDHKTIERYNVVEPNTGDNRDISASPAPH